MELVAALVNAWVLNPEITPSLSPPVFKELNQSIMNEMAWTISVNYRNKCV